MKKQKKSEYERFMELSDAEKDREVAKYDSPGSIPTSPLRASDKALHRKAQRQAGRPKLVAARSLCRSVWNAGCLKRWTPLRGLASSSDPNW